MVVEVAPVKVVVQMEDGVRRQMEGGLHLQMKDAVHLQMADHHLQEALAAGHQKEEAVLQEQEATDHIQEAATAEVIAGEKVHHQKVEAAQLVDADTKKVALLQTGEN